MVSRIIRTLALVVMALSMSSAASAQQPPQRGRGDGQRGGGQRGAPQQRGPATYYGGGVYGPGYRQQTPIWGVPAGRWYQGQYQPYATGPCWTNVPFLGWTWTCGP